MIEPVDYTTPVDVLEPEGEVNEYREASLAYLQIVSLAISFITEANEPLTAAYGVAYALGLISVVGNTSMRAKARELGLSSGTLSHASRRFSKLAGLPPSALQQDEERISKAREARNKVVGAA